LERAQRERIIQAGQDEAWQGKARHGEACFLREGGIIVKGYELLARIDIAKTIFTWVKIAKTQDGCDDGEEWMSVSLDREDLKKQIKEWIDGCNPPGWGMFDCEFNARWESGARLIGEGEWEECKDGEGEGVLVIDEHRGRDMGKDMGEEDEGRTT
jgi:hypothetical protein